MKSDNSPGQLEALDDYLLGIIGRFNTWLYREFSVHPWTLDLIVHALGIILTLVTICLASMTEDVIITSLFTIITIPYLMRQSRVTYLLYRCVQIEWKDSTYKKAMVVHARSRPRWRARASLLLLSLTMIAFFWIYHQIEPAPPFIGALALHFVLQPIRTFIIDSEPPRPDDSGHHSRGWQPSFAG